MAQFVIKEGDYFPRLRQQLVTGGSPINLSGTLVNFKLTQYGGTGYKVNSTVTIIDAAQGIVEYVWSGTDTDTPGQYAGEFTITYANGTQRVPTDSYITVIVSPSL